MVSVRPMRSTNTVARKKKIWSVISQKMETNFNAMTRLLRKTTHPFYSEKAFRDYLVPDLNDIVMSGNVLLDLNELIYTAIRNATVSAKPSSSEVTWLTKS